MVPKRAAESPALPPPSSEDEVTAVASPPPTTNQAPPPPQTTDSEDEEDSEATDDSEDEEQEDDEDEEVDYDESGIVWSPDDEIRILEALVAHRQEHGVLPEPDALFDALAGKLDNRDCSSEELQSKVNALRHWYKINELSHEIWGDDAGGNTAAAANGDEGATDNKIKRQRRPHQ